MLHTQRLLGLACLTLVACAATGSDPDPSSAPPAGSFELQMQEEAAGQRYRYRLDVPDASARPDAGWPLLVFLHGAGERGDDLARVAVHGPLKMVGEVPELQACLLAAPQCPDGAWWDPAALDALVDELLARPDVDPDRVYLTGLSMGGYGTWGLLARQPERFAAAVPICGGGQSGRLWPEAPNGFELEGLLTARDVPVRAFHGADDRLIPAEESRVLVDALREVGADVELTVYPGVGHDSWTRTYADPSLYTWLFAQSR